MNDWISALAKKWHEIPTGGGIRVSTADQLRLPDAEFLAWWEAVAARQSAQDFYHWIFEIYSDFVRGKRLVDVGPGAGVLGVQFLRAGASITFVDVVEPNLCAIERVCQLKQLTDASFVPIKSFAEPLHLHGKYDAVFAIGSLHHAPSAVTKREFETLASCLKIGGRFVALTYPKERWIREGSKSFDQFGKGTDGEATPWAEWYDLDKILAQLAPHRFRSLMSFNFHDDDFNWFDLQRVG